MVGCPVAIGAEERSDEATIASGARLGTGPLSVEEVGLTVRRTCAGCDGLRSLAAKVLSDGLSGFLKVCRYSRRVCRLAEEEC